MLASFTSFLPSALQLHSSPEKSTPAISSNFKPDNEDDDDDNDGGSARSSAPGQSAVNELGVLKNQKGKDKKGANETFIFVRPPPSKSNHPLNLQVQLVPPNSRGPSGLTPTSTTSITSTGVEGNTPVTATPGRQSFDQAVPRRQGTDDSVNDLSRVSSNRSDASTAVYSTGYSSVSSFSSVASTSTSASSQSTRRTIIPLYNLQAHNVMTNTIVDAGTDAKIAKFQKRCLEMIGLATLEPVEVWPASGNNAQQAPSTPATTSGFAQPRSNRASIDSRRPYGQTQNGSGFLHPQQDRSSRPVTPTMSEDLHGHTPTSSRLSVSSAGVDSTSHQVHPGYKEYHPHHAPHPYPSQVMGSLAEGTPSAEGTSAGGKKNIFGKLFKRKTNSATTTPGSDLSSPDPSISSPTPKIGLPEVSPSGSMLASPPMTSPLPMQSPSPISPDTSTTPTMPSASNKFVAASQHLNVSSPQQHHRTPSAPVSHGETPTPTARAKRQVASFNLPGIIGKGSALIGRGTKEPDGSRKSPSPHPPPLPPREHATSSEDAGTTTITSGRGISKRSSGIKTGAGDSAATAGKRDSGHFGPVTPTDSSGSVNVHNPPTPTPAPSQLNPAPTQALRPPILGIQPALSIVSAGSKAASNAKSHRATMYVWIVRRWLKGSDNGLLGNLGKIGSGVGQKVIGLGIGKERDDDRKRDRSATRDGNSIGKGNEGLGMFEVRFEWKRGKSSKAGKKKEKEREGRTKQRRSLIVGQGERGSVVIGNPPPGARDRDWANGSMSRPASRVESKASLKASTEGNAGDGAGSEGSPRDKARKRLSLLSHQSTSTGAGTSDEHLQNTEGGRPRSRSRAPTKDDARDNGDEEEDGEESDPEDSETPWTCTLKVKRLGSPSSGETIPGSESGLLAPLTTTNTRSPRTSAISRASLDLNPGGSAGQPSQSLKLKLGTLSPTPHHPKVVAMLKVPFPLSDVEVEGMNVRKRQMPGHRVQQPQRGGDGLPARPATSSGVKNEQREGGDRGLELTAEELKDVVCSTGMWLVVREGFGGVGKEKRKGDGWRIRA